VAAINGMQVKGSSFLTLPSHTHTDLPPDYLQHLQDENKISVEKIGSGNWYWCFASEEKKTRERALAEATSAHDKAASVVDDLKQKLAAVNAQHEDEAEMLDNGGDSREELVASKATLEEDVKKLQKALATYSDMDPTELERKKAETKRFQQEAEQFTDEIYFMEGWLKDHGVDGENLTNLRIQFYGEEFDQEEGMLKELA